MRKFEFIEKNCQNQPKSGKILDIQAENLKFFIFLGVRGLHTSHAKHNKMKKYLKFKGAKKQRGIELSKQVKFVPHNRT